MISAEEKWLMHALESVLCETETPKLSMKEYHSLDWNRVLMLAQTHAVVPFLYPFVEKNYVDEPLYSAIRNTCTQTVQQSYRLMFLTHYIVKKLNEAGVTVVVLKGVSAAACYPTPELRKSGDIDLFLIHAKDSLERASHVMEDAGFQREMEQRVNHHHVWRTQEGIEVELHVMFAEPFDNDCVNEYLEQMSRQVDKHVVNKDIMGLCFPVLTDAYQAYQLLLHMLQHFLRSGFGLKLLCDWVVFWNQNRKEEERIRYLRLIAESGLEGFSDMVTSICMKYLGLREDLGNLLLVQKKKTMEYESFLKDILEAAEFGQNDDTRMVVLRGTGMKDYMREFHHQMRLTFPNASQHMFLWPILWIKVFYGFCRNNRQIRGVSTWQVLKKAGARSKHMAQLRLFQKNVKNDN